MHFKCRLISCLKLRSPSLGAPKYLVAPLHPTLSEQILYTHHCLLSQHCLTKQSLPVLPVLLMYCRWLPVFTLHICSNVWSNGAEQSRAEQVRSSTSLLLEQMCSCCFSKQKSAPLHYSNSLLIIISVKQLTEKDKSQT